MKTLIYILTAFIIFFISPDNFKNKQLKYSRVRTAYVEKETGMKKLLNDNSIRFENLTIYIRVFKQEKELELWAKNVTDKSFKLIKTYDICRTCGTLGPKRQMGDLQIPEGFYYIDAFNPTSSYYLSMRINYPNKSDKILGVKTKLGGDIFIHGACVTIGCIPITDEQIKELYIFCVEAKNNGQSNIPVTIYPANLTNKKFITLIEKYATEKDKINLWTDLKTTYDNFIESKQLPNIEFLTNGRHEIK
ncbi:L,D-transpeptidase family protein [Draconibacterium sp.]|nr:L,D-transpeptidase family protein [Draconibacterium sp.]